jgi:N-acetylglucosaminyldiphosphoundecaprenol N-acetyl-beta-D-mannosaminyltransferase
MRRLCIILGIPVDDLSIPEALDRLEQFIRVGRLTGKGHQIATVNADFVVKAQTDPELRYLLQESDMATADGMPLVWGARLLGVRLAGRLTGADLVPALVERAAKKGYTVYLLGGAPGVAERAATVLKERFPGLRIVGVLCPPYRSSVLEMDQAIIEQIKSANPDILLVAFGNPKQEKWIGMHGRELGVPVMIGIGGTLDFISGKIKRAPRWMQNAGLEWSYRLLQEPRRLWRRYAVDLVSFGTFFVRQWWIMRSNSEPAPLLPRADLVVVDGTAIVRIHGRLDVNGVTAFHDLVQGAFAETPFVVVNLEDATFLDSSAIGTLVALAKEAREAGGRLSFTSVPPAIARTLSLLRLDRLFHVGEDTNSVAEVRNGLQKPETMVDSGNGQTSRAGAWQVLRMPERVDASTALDIQRRCSDLLMADPHLVLDFSRTDFLASAGLAVLANLRQRTTHQQGELRLAGCSRDVRRVFELVGFDRLLVFCDDVDDAIRSLPRAVPERSRSL